MKYEQKENFYFLKRKIRKILEMKIFFIC